MSFYKEFTSELDFCRTVILYLFPSDLQILVMCLGVWVLFSSFREKTWKIS